MIKKSKSRQCFEIFNIIIMLLLIILCLYPILHIVFASVSKPSLLMHHEGLLLKPVGFSMAAYKSLFKTDRIVNGYINTFIVMGFGLALNLILTIIGAYFFASKNILFKKPLMFLVTFTMFFSGGLIPFFLTVKMLGLYNSLWAVIFPSAISTFNLIILRTAFEQLLASIEEAARIDGANDFQVLFKIIVPLSTASIAVIVLYYAVSHWNSWFNAMIFLQNKQLYPLQLVLREFLLEEETDSMIGGNYMGDFEGVSETIKYAVICFATLPILCVYPFLQKYFVKGVMVGAVKG